MCFESYSVSTRKRVIYHREERWKTEDGYLCDSREISELATKHNALLFIDECHATGFFGKNGRGTEEALGKLMILN